jgi:hypothetical protein
MPTVHAIGGSLSHGSSCLGTLIGEVGLGGHLIILFEESHQLPNQHILVILTG